MKAATPAETVASVSDIPLTRTPGTSFSYTNTGYVLLGMVIEHVSGKSYEQFLQDEIFGPLGMKDSGYEHGDTPGLATGYADGFTVADPLDMSVPYAAGGLYSTVLDLERWEEALYTDTLAPAADMARYFTPLIDSTDRVGFAYGYGQYIGDDPGSKLVWHDGGINGFYTQLSQVCGRPHHGGDPDEPRDVAGPCIARPGRGEGRSRRPDELAPPMTGGSNQP